MTLTPIQMGARLYFPTLGRFAQVDPIPGGNPNDYIYPTDPINMLDLSGMAGIPLFDNYYNHCRWICSRSLPATIQRAASNPVKSVPHKAAAKAPASKPAAAAGSAPPPVSHWIAAGAVATSKHPILGDMSKLPQGPGSSRPTTTQPRNFSFMDAGRTAMDYGKAGGVFGEAVGCAVGAVGISFVASPAAAPVGCVAGGPVGIAVGVVLFGAAGFVIGGFGFPGAEGLSQ